MPQIASAKKRVRVATRQAVENRLHRSRSRTAIKQVRDLLAAGQTKEAASHLATAQSYLDKAAKTHALHPNTAARHKSRLVKALKKASLKEATPTRSKAKTLTKQSPAQSKTAKATAKPRAKSTKQPAAKRPLK